MNAQTAKITPGVWIVINGTDVFTSLGATNAHGICADNNDAWQIADCGQGITFVEGIEHDLSFDEQEANAYLIAEAGTVANETGLSPRQLADQRAELLGLLQELIDIEGPQPGTDGWADKVRSAIIRATGEQP